MTARLVAISAQAAAAPHGRKESIYAAACAELGISRASLMRKLNEVAVKAERKQRTDAGDVSLPRTEAVLISALLMESLRKNNKRLLSIGQAVDMLRRNGAVRAERIDTWGEITPLSEAAITRALRTYSLHPEQLLRATPATELKSLHPNHVWQIDASLCVLYYLKAAANESGIQVMDHDKFYKNKPANVARIAADRVWRYAVTDHYSGTIFVHYVMGAESGANLAESFIAATQKRDDKQYPVHGVPLILMMDMGSANTSGLFKNLARRLQVKLMPHAVGNARATGQVEGAQNIIEKSFESGLRFKPVADLADLNATAHRWMCWFNGTQEHTRHGHTRFAMWQTIAEQQLRIAPSIELCRELLTHEPETRKVSPTLTVSFKGREFDVSAIPRVMVGETLLVSYNVYRPDAAVIVDRDAEGAEQLHEIPEVVRDDAGFRADANVIGEGFRRLADTELDTNRKEIQRIGMDADTLEAADAARKAKKLPFGGRIDPFKGFEEEASAATYLPRKGTALDTGVTVASTDRIMTRFETAAELKRRGVDMTVERNGLIAAWYPDGVPESALDDVQTRLTTRPSLRVVGGES